MKNSLFKRAAAAMAAVPLALTQCLTVANAATIADSVSVVSTKTADANSNTTFTLNEGVETSILYITPGIAEGASDDEYVQNGNVFEKESNWNTRVNSALVNLGKGSNNTGTINLDGIYEEALNRAGNYREVAENLISKIGPVEYTVAEDGSILLTADVSNITPAFTKGGAKTIGGAMKDLAEKYNAPELRDEAIFSDIDISGHVSVLIHGEDLKDDTNISAEIVFVDNNMKSYAGTEILEYAASKFEEMKAAAKAACAEAGIDMDDANKQIDDSVSFYMNKIKSAKSGLAKALKYNRTKDYSESGNFAGFLADVNKRKARTRYANKKDVPGSGVEIAGLPTVSKIYNELLTELNKAAAPNVVDITAEDLGAYLDELYDLNGTVSNGKGEATAKFADKEEADVRAYFAEAYPDYEITAIYKEVTVNGDITALSNGQITVGATLKRVVEVQPIVTTTTTTTTDTETTTTTTTTDTETTTTTTTTYKEGDTTTTTTTTEEVGDTTTTTTTTEEGGSDTTTTTTDTVPFGQTTTTQVVTTAINYKIESVPGFYLDIDESFNLAQVQTVSVSYDEMILSYDEDGVEVNKEVTAAGESVDLLGKVNFGDATPNNTYTPDSYVFSHQVTLKTTEDITLPNGEVLPAGSELVQTSGEKVSVTAYIGVKGDANLDHNVDAGDASDTLAWYALLSTGKSASDNIFARNSALVTDAADILDHFACFLCDVTNEPNVDPDNWCKMKAQREMLADDATWILAYYSKKSTGSEPGRPLWNTVQGL